MKILVVSDTHGKEAELRALIAKYQTEIELVLHLGDHAEDLISVQGDFSQITCVAIDGNTDYGGVPERTLTLRGRRIFMTHGHYRNVRVGTDQLLYYAKENDIDICLYGHTHVQEMATRDDVFIMNPGSLVEPRGGSRAGYGLIDISDEGEILGEIIGI